MNVVNGSYRTRDMQIGDKTVPICSVGDKKVSICGVGAMSVMRLRDSFIRLSCDFRFASKKCSSRD